jgi:peptide/nickel transport system permease protein
MSTQSVITGKTPLPAAEPWLAGVWRHAMQHWPARLGLLWIVAIAFCALFAPLLANSHPLLMKAQGAWSSPLLRHLTPADVILLLLGFVGLPFLLRFRRLPFADRVLIVLGAVLVAIPLALWLVRAPTVVVYEQYRQMQTDGKVQFALRAPIPYSPSDRLRDQPNPDPPFPWEPSRAHLLGTDVNGQDIAANMIHACRIAMSVGFISTGIAVLIGIVVGGLMGYFSGWSDLLGMRVVEIFAAIPTIYLLLAFVAYYGRNIYVIMAIIGLTSWVGDARFIRAEFLKLRNQDFVQAAIAAGLPLRRVLFRHILPNAIAPLLVSASFGVAGAILAESTLSFLGLGLVDEASWGRLLDMARGEGGGFHWWIATFPGLAIFLTVLSYNFIGEALRDALDPRLYGGRA